MSIKEEKSTVDMDFTCSEFVMRNINCEKYFFNSDIVNQDCRQRMIRTACDQVCFYVMCALRAYSLVEEIPVIVIYGGGGVMGSYIINALVEHGCKPLLKILAREMEAVKAWVKLGFRSAVKLSDENKVDVLIIASNVMSFSQLCKDVGKCIKPTTFVISTSFCLQRKRLYNLFDTPGVFRTYLERKMSRRKKHASAKLLLSRKDALLNTVMLLENYMVMLGVPPESARGSSLHLLLGRSGVAPLTSSGRHSFVEEESPSMDMASMSPSHQSAEIFTPVKQPRRSSEGTDFLSSVPEFPSIASGTKNPRRFTSASTLSVSYICSVMDDLQSSIGVPFQEELSKNVSLLELPSIEYIINSPSLNPVVRKWKTRSRLTWRKDTRAQSKAISSGYLDEKALIHIFDCDKKVANNKKRSTLLEDINKFSNDEFDEEEFDVFNDDHLSEESDKFAISPEKFRRSSTRNLNRLDSDVYVGKNDDRFEELFNESFPMILEKNE